MTDALPDPDWYLDNVVLLRDRHGQHLGPAAERRQRWAAAADRVADIAESPAVRNAVALALRQGFVLTRAQARDCGVPEAAIRRRLRRQRWTAPRRGVLAVLPEPDAAIAASAAVLRRRGHVTSHRSAAHVHGLPVLADPPVPELTAASAAVRRDAIVHGATLGHADVTDWYGAPVTSVARTIVDLAREERRQGLVAADAALHERLVSRDDLAAVIERCRRWPGVAAAREVVGLASELAESPLESLIRLCLHDGGLDAPYLQVWITDPADGWRCRVDMMWRHEGVVLEADGRVKYTGRELWREKRRQERIERLGFRVVRVLWSDLARPDETVARVRRALAAGTLRPD